MCAVGCGIWVLLALTLRRGYVAAITDSLYQYRLDIERAAAASMDRSASTVLAAAFDGGDPDAILYVLKAYAQSGRRPPLDAVRALLTHESPKSGPGRWRPCAPRPTSRSAPRPSGCCTTPTSRCAPRRCSGWRITPASIRWCRSTPWAISRTSRSAPAWWRSTAGRAATRTSKRRGCSSARWPASPVPTGRRARVEAATLLGRLSGEDGAELADLASLLADDDSEVASAAVTAAAKASRLDLVAAVATRLEDETVRRAAHDALAAFGPPALPALGGSSTTRRCR